MLGLHTRRSQADNILDKTYNTINVPRPLTNDLWVFLFQTIDTECVNCACPAGTYAYVIAFIVNVNKCLKPFFSRTTYQDCK